MTQAAMPAVSVAQTELKAGALKLPSIFMQSLTMVAPGIAACFYTPFVVTQAGLAAPLAYPIAFVIVLLTAVVLAELPDHELAFANSWRDAVSAIGTEEAQAAVLLPPVRIGQIGDWARARRRMPPKSTFFHPKPRTGMVFRPLDPA